MTGEARYMKIQKRGKAEGLARTLEEDIVSNASHAW